MTDSAGHARRANRRFEKMIGALEDEGHDDLCERAERLFGDVDQLTGDVIRRGGAE